MTEAVQEGDFLPKTVSQQLYRQLCHDMCEGLYTPGQVVSIRGIAQRYDTTTMPAREAVRWLVAAGALEFVDSRKIIVPELNQERFNDVLFARRTMEGEISERAFPHITAAVIDELEAIDQRLNQTIREDNLTAYMQTNYQFHFTIYKLGKSKTLLQLVELLWLQYGPSMRYICSRWDKSPAAHDHHAEIISALRAGDMQAFRAAVEADVEQGMQLIVE